VAARYLRNLLGLRVSIPRIPSAQEAAAEWAWPHARRFLSKETGTEQAFQHLDWTRLAGDNFPKAAA